MDNVQYNDDGVLHCISKKMIRNLLPQDTRIIEIASALSLIALCLSLVIGNISHSILSFQSREFWSVVLFSFGVLQLWSIIVYPKAELLRCTMAWICGSFWVWIGISGDMATFFIGIGNLYSFIINFNLLRRAWET